jgi:AbrB family looped-hinge helix DNA binding protein
LNNGYVWPNFLEMAEMAVVCYNSCMQDRVTIGRRGSITIPARLREACGLKPNDELIIEPSNGCLLLRPVVGEAIEIYTDDRIAEFASDEEALGRLLPKE